jgi:hypothetical protein
MHFTQLSMYTVMKRVIVAVGQRLCHYQELQEPTFLVGRKLTLSMEGRSCLLLLWALNESLTCYVFLRTCSDLSKGHV